MNFKKDTIRIIELLMREGWGPKKVFDLVRENGDCEKLFFNDGSSVDTPHNITEELKRELEYMRLNDVKPVSFWEEEYPALLKHIHLPPPVIYTKGSFSFEGAVCVSIVGARRCSYYGAAMAEKISYDLALRGITIVSGLARGIDTAAHKGALKAGGHTIAVLGSGLNNIYPVGSEGLSREIMGNGLIVTEYPSDTGPRKENFPRRNRIISGLSLGTIVVEASNKSGALITASFALEQGREVLAIPGQADSVFSAGTNNLIKNGARLVTGWEDIAEEIFQVKEKINSMAMNNFEDSIDFTPEENTVLNCIKQNNGKVFDEIVASVNLPAEEVSRSLLELELKRVVRSHPGGVYSMGLGA